MTLVVRAASLDAAMSHYLVEQVDGTPKIEVRLATEVIGGGRDADDWLDWLVLRPRDGGEEETVRADALFLMIGADPNSGWLPAEVERDSGGYLLTGADLDAERGWPLEREPLDLETSVPGVFAAGDVRHGSLNRVASAVGEGSIAVRLVHELFEAERRSPRQPA